MKEIFKNDGTPKAIVKGQSIVIINKDSIISESYFGGISIEATANGDLDIVRPKVPEYHTDSWIEAVDNFKNRVVKAVPEEPKEEDEINIDESNLLGYIGGNATATTKEDAPEKRNPEFKHQDDADYWDFSESEEITADTVTKSDKENLPAEYVETPYAKVLRLIEDFIKEYEENLEIPTHSCDLYAEHGYNGICCNSKIGHAPYYFRLIVENEPKINTIYMCFDPRRHHGAYKAATQRVGGSDNGAYVCRLTFATGSSYKRLLTPGDVSGWEIHNKEISDLLKEIKEVFEASEIERDAFCGSYHI